MHLYRLMPWARYPCIDVNNNIALINPLDLIICEQKCVNIDTGLILLSLPSDHIIKIVNRNNSYIILTSFWIPSSENLSLTIISKHSLQLQAGEILCHLQILPIHHFLPGNTFLL